MKHLVVAIALSLAASALYAENTISKPVAVTSPSANDKATSAPNDKDTTAPKEGEKKPAEGEKK